MLGPFRISLHARPSDGTGSTSEIAATLFTVDFETLYERLEALPDMFIEPDGSFVRRSPGEWQLDGHLYDRAGRMVYVDLLGTCPAACFDEILSKLDVAAEDVIVQLRESGRYVACETFLDARGRME